MPRPSRSYRRAIEIDEKSLGKDHPTVATDYNNLAVSLQYQGKYADAEPLYRRAIEIDEKTLGKDHPDVARDYNNLAGLLQNQGKYAEAEPLYRRAIEIDEKTLGKDHPTLLAITTISPTCFRTRASMPRPSRSIGGRSRYSNPVLARTTQTLYRSRETTMVCGS